MEDKRQWPLISVCTISFNRLDYLKTTLESFRKTCTYPNLEFIIVDNGSTSEVIEYIKSIQYIEKKIFNKENMGIGYALNQARKEAHGVYYFNLENDWYFFYKSDWMERGVLLFEKDKRGEHIPKIPPPLPLGLVKYKLGANIINYTNNPALMSKKSYLDVGEFPEIEREYIYVSEDITNIEPHYIKEYKSKYACTLSETPCAVHIGGYTTNPNYGKRLKKNFEKLDELLKGKWKNGKWWLAYQYMKLGNKWKIKKALRHYKKFEMLRENCH